MRKVIGSRDVYNNDRKIEDRFITDSDIPDFVFNYVHISQYANIETLYNKVLNKKEYCDEDDIWLPKCSIVHNFPYSTYYRDDQRTRIADLYSNTGRSCLKISKKQMEDYECIIYKYNLSQGSKEYVYNSITGELMEAIFSTETKKLDVNFCAKTAKLNSLTNKKCSSLASYEFVENDAIIPLSIMHPYLINTRKSLDDFLNYDYDTDRVISHISSEKYEKDMIIHSNAKLSKTMRYPIDMMISPFCVADCDYAEETIIYDDENGAILSCSIDYIANCD